MKTRARGTIRFAVPETATVWAADVAVKFEADEPPEPRTIYVLTAGDDRVPDVAAAVRDAFGAGTALVSLRKLEQVAGLYLERLEGVSNQTGSRIYPDVAELLVSVGVACMNHRDVYRDRIRELEARLARYERPDPS